MNIAFAGLRHAHIYSLAANVLYDPRHRVTGAWEEDGQARAEAERTFPRFYPSYEALLADGDVQIVAIGDHYGIRGERVRRALEAGKHVIVDKPVCTNLAELDEIERLTRVKGLKLSCMLDLRYDPALQKAAELIRGGELGEIHALSFTGQHPLDWGTRPMWYFEEGKHGGTFNDIAVHGLDAVRMMSGLEVGKVLCARQWNAFAKHAPKFRDRAQLMARMRGGAGLIADVSYAAPSPAGYKLPGYWRFSFWGERGWMELQAGRATLQMARTGDAQPLTVEAGEARGNCFEDLCREIAGKRVRFDTASSIRAARDALELQKTADEMEENGK